MKSAQRLSATLSIRPRGRVQIIDMGLGSILVCEDIRTSSANLQTLCEDFERLCIRQIISAFRDDMCTKLHRDCHIGCGVGDSAVCAALPALQRFLDEIAKTLPRWARKSNTGFCGLRCPPVTLKSWRRRAGGR